MNETVRLLNIIFDCSGSFAIRGKKNLLMYAYHGLKSVVQSADMANLRFSYFCWQGNEICPLEDEEALQHPQGTSDYTAFCTFLTEASERLEPCLLMTDGCTDSWDRLSSLPQTQKELVSIVLMGATADWQMAESTGICLYSLADLPVAVRDMSVCGTGRSRC